MQIINPTKDNLSTIAQILRWAQSVYKCLNKGVSIAQPAGSQDSAGRFNTFNQDNLDCVLLYIGAAGSGANLVWNANNVAQQFNHGLLRQPIGSFVVYKTKTCDVYNTATPTANTISLANTDSTATTIVVVF